MGDEPTEPAGLGNVVRVFRPRPWWIGLAVCAFALAGLLALRLSVKTEPGSALNPILALALAVAGGGTFLCGIMSFSSLRQRVAVHENGLVVRGLAYSRTVRWEDIDKVYFNMKNLTLGRTASVKTRDDVKISFPGLIVGHFAAPS